MSDLLLLALGSGALACAVAAFVLARRAGLSLKDALVAGVATLAGLLALLGGAFLHRRRRTPRDIIDEDADGRRDRAAREAAEAAETREHLDAVEREPLPDDAEDARDEAASRWNGE